MKMQCKAAKQCKAATRMEMEENFSYLLKHSHCCNFLFQTNFELNWVSKINCRKGFHSNSHARMLLDSIQHSLEAPKLYFVDSLRLKPSFLLV